jgi:hypothetical protein
MKNLFKTKKSTSFTMIELSIVLLVLGLLLAGALSVGGLIERARMQRILTEVDPLKKSFLMFKDTYGQYPLLSNQQCQQYSEFKPVISGDSTSYIGGTGTPTYTAESSTRCGFSSGTTAINTNYPSNTSGSFLDKGCYALRQMQWVNLVSGVPLANAGGVCNWWATTGTPSFRDSSLVSKADNEMRIFFSELDGETTRFAYELYTGGNASYEALMPVGTPVIVYFSNKAMVGIKSATAAKISQKITGSENAYASRLFTGVKVLGVSSTGDIAWRDGQSVSCTSLADNSTAIKNAAGYKGQGAVSYLKDGVCSLVFAIED